MADVQVEKGYLRMATQLIDAFCWYHLNGREWQVLWAIIRKTYGWKKKDDHISLSQIAKMTHLKRDKVCKIVNDLVKKGVAEKGNSYVRNLRLVKDYDKWVVLPKRATVAKKSNGVLPKMGTKLLPKKATTIDTITTNTIDNMPTARDCLKYFGKAFEKKFGVGYVAAFGKEGKLFKDLLKNASFKEISTVIDAFFSSEDEFIAKSGHTVGVFISQFNKLRINPNNTTDSPALRELKRITGEE